MYSEDKKNGAELNGCGILSKPISTLPEVIKMTYGQKAVGLTFNPSENRKVEKIKRLYAEIIDLLNEENESKNTCEQTRLLKIAITEAQTAQMWAVKGITYQY
jgi:hypothetical protein